MNWFLYLFGSGSAYFLGAGLILLAVPLHCWANGRWQQVVANQAARIGLLLSWISAVPQPYWLYGIASFFTVGWLITQNAHSESWRRRTHLWRAATVVSWVVMMAAEAPYQRLPRIRASEPARVAIIADSITAGISEQEETWPKRMAGKHAIDIHDLSRAGATVGSALRQAEQVSPEEGLVLLEIGGNDLLGSTTLREFERDLELLLAQLARPGRTLVMFELPLPPLCNEYGLIQRRLANRYGVQLIPKRVLMGILTGHAATTDTIHLDHAGHERMAEVVWRLITSDK